MPHLPAIPPPAKTTAKRKHAIDHLPERPFHALEEAWDENEMYLSDTHHDLQLWFSMALGHEGSVYNDLEDRAPFIQFYNDFLPFVEALYFLREAAILTRDNRDSDFKAITQSFIKSRERNWLSEDQFTNLYAPVANFCCKYELSYIRTELWDFFDAVQYYLGPLQTRLNRSSIHKFYGLLLCVSEAAYVITFKNYEDLVGNQVKHTKNSPVYHPYP
jgi:hypothetical protein